MKKLIFIFIGFILSASAIAENLKVRGVAPGKGKVSLAVYLRASNPLCSLYNTSERKWERFTDSEYKETSTYTDTESSFAYSLTSNFATSTCKFKIISISVGYIPENGTWMDGWNLTIDQKKYITDKIFNAKEETPVEELENTHFETVSDFTVNNDFVVNF